MSNNRIRTYNYFNHAFSILQYKMNLLYVMHGREYIFLIVDVR